MTSGDIADTLERAAWNKRAASLDSLTGLRFFAALVVLLRHSVPELFPLPGLQELSLVGPIGVGFFFVLSGFILTWTWKPHRTLRNFYIRRLARIGPLHVLTTIVAAGLLIAAGTPHWLSTILSLFLLQAWGTENMRSGGNGPSWSLSVEVFFYLCFPFLVRPLLGATIRRCVTIGFGAAAGMLLWTIAYGVGSQMDLPAITVFSTYTNPLYRLGEFVIGICLAVAMRKGWSIRMSLPRATLLAVAGYIGLALANWGVMHAGVHLGDTKGLPLGVLDLAYLPMTVLLIAAAAASDIAGLPSALRGRWMVSLGKWSFALYLIQMIVIAPVTKFAQPGVSWLGAFLLVGTILVCIAMSALLYRFIERPLESGMKQRLAR